MIYFLINNNYHLYDVNLLYKDLKTEDLGLIQVPHTLDVVTNDPRFIKNFHFGKMESILWNSKINKKRFDEIRNSLHITNQDILLVYTEFEIVNQLIIELFYNKGAKVYLLEDGTATQHVFNFKPQKPKLKTKFREYILKTWYNLKYTHLLYDGNVIFPVMNDSFFNGAFLYYNIDTRRNIEIIKIKNNTQKISVKPSTALFLNQDMYNFYESFSSYIKTLDVVLQNMTQNFDTVYFKFHPRERNCPEYSQIEELVKVYGCYIIEEEDAIDVIANKYRPSHSISYLSASGKNLAFMGIEPIFIYHLFSQYNGQLVAENFTTFLKSIGYHFVSDISEMNSSYKSFIIDTIQNESSINNYLADNQHER